MEDRQETNATEFPVPSANSEQTFTEKGKDTPFSLIETESPINHNKPWRLVIRRRISDGGSDNKSIYGNEWHY